jgi:hypothetical protein
MDQHVPRYLSANQRGPRARPSMDTKAPFLAQTSNELAVSLARAGKANPPASDKMGAQNRRPNVEEAHFLRSISFTCFPWCWWTCPIGAWLAPVSARNVLRAQCSKLGKTNVPYASVFIKRPQLVEPYL